MDVTNPLELQMEKLHEHAAHGDVNGISEALRAMKDVNAANSHGWTALMFAARNGHVNAVKLLLENGCDTSMVNSSGQTACDIAEFWLHENVVVELRAAAVARETSPVTLPGVQATRVSNYFTESPLDRMSHKRTDTEWLCELSLMESTVYILFINLNIVAAQYEQAMPSYSKSVYRAVRFKYSQIKSWLNLPNNPATVVFLGVENPPGSKPPHGDINIGWFAVDVTSATTIENIQQTICPQAELISIHPRLLSMPRAEAAIVGQGRSLLAWHDRYQFCPTCGSRTELQEVGYKRKCTKEICRSQNGVHNTCYPRIDPTVIMAVVSQDKQRLLLGRGRRFPGPMYSCLAGFMEPGESIEEACRREVMEESGVEVGHVEYHSCQPWPMPCSLMIGCIGHAVSDVIKVDKTELEDARWFSAQDVRLMMTRQHPDGLFLPPSQAIAHQLIKHALVTMAKL